MSDNPHKLVLIDGNSILNRAYFAMSKNPLTDSTGQNVSAVYGFINILFKIIAEHQPTNIVVAFDERAKTFRHNMYDGYKSTRKGMPDDLAVQLPILKELLSAMKIKMLSKEGFEADDIIGTLSKRFDCQTMLFSGDKDLFQLIDDSTTVLLTIKGVSEIETVDVCLLKDKYGLSPEQVIEFKALRGDTADCIPGVKGVGEITARELIATYRSIDGVYANIDSIKSSVRDKLLADRDMCYLSKQLATIDTQVDIDCTLDNCPVPTEYDDSTRRLLEKLRFKSVLAKLHFVGQAHDDTQATTPSVDIVEVVSMDQLTQLADKLSRCEQVSINLGEDICLSNSTQREYVIKISNNLLDGVSYAWALNCLRNVFEGQCGKILYDAKATRHVLDDNGINLNNVVADVSIMQYLIEYRVYKDLDALLHQYNYQQRASGLMAVSQLLKTQLINDGLIDLYDNIELPLNRVLFEMEKTGVKIDLDALNTLNEQFSIEIDQLNEQVYQIAGERFNIASTQQLAVVLFDKLGLPAMKKTKTGYSTDSEVLDTLKSMHPIVPLIIKIRQLSKLNGTYIVGMKQHIKSGNLIHTQYNQTLTSTGRLSSSEPNLQNIPIRDEEGRKIRKLFIPRNDTLVSADYSQIELRLLAHFSQDENMLHAFNSGEDIHAKVASEIYNVQPELVTDKMRRTAKAVNFGIIYGISEYGLAEGIGIAPSKAREYIKKYFSSYPRIKAYLDSSIHQAEELGYVTTLTGRRRQIPELKSSNYQLRQFGRRAAMNMPLQGTAADIIKIAMINVDNRLKRDNLKSSLIMQIHDELVIDCYSEETEQVKTLLKEEMENAIQLNVKLTVSVGSGSNLYDAK
ncbi:MAG: DNA polymerase I [Clostridia bacterium]|nr:DNA polymerase I [Clostridia bacterium]